MFLRTQPAVSSSIPVLVVVCCVAGVILGGFVGVFIFKGSDKLRRKARSCVAWMNTRPRAGDGIGLAEHGLALPASPHIARSDDVADTTATARTTSIACALNYATGHTSMADSLPDATFASATGYSSARASVSHHSSQNTAPAIAAEADIGLWDGSVVPWGLIAASATPCASSVFEDDSEDDAKDGDNVGGDGEDRKDGPEGTDRAITPVA